MTERQGGSDVRSNTTRAEPDPAAGDGAVRLTGHKWFFSAPQCDGHLVLAREDAGLSCFLLPRFLPDGARNAVRINRLKDKLGNRSNASSEVEFERALAWPIGEPGRGVATILEMVQHTRLDCVLGTAGMMRAALARAIHYARHRVAFGRLLVAQPLMRNVLADLALEVEAATALALRLARAFESDAPDSERALARVATPAAKFWLCKRGPAQAAEAMEVLGGSGYVEESALPRIYREMPVNSIWEGSGNVICLDVVRAVRARAGGRRRAARRKSRRRAARIRHSTHTRRSSRAILRRAPTTNGMAAGSRNGSPCRCRRRCCSGTRPNAGGLGVLRVSPRSGAVRRRGIRRAAVGYGGGCDHRPRARELKRHRGAGWTTPCTS